MPTLSRASLNPFILAAEELEGDSGKERILRKLRDELHKFSRAIRFAAA
jgi:hypothetical protein